MPENLSNLYQSKLFLSHQLLLRVGQCSFQWLHLSLGSSKKTFLPVAAFSLHWQECFFVVRKV
jgi:hypothetical protein